MTRRVVFRPQALAELLEARRWYDERRPGLGAEFAGAVEGLVESIQRKPLSHPKVRGETRRAILRRFPYVIHFRAIEEEVIVLAVTHGRRDPGHWRSQT